MEKKFTYLLLLAFTTLSLTTSAQNSALLLNGTTDYVTIPSQLVPTSGPFAVEFWAYINAYGSGGTWVSQGTAGSHALYLGYDNAGNIVAGDAWSSSTNEKIALNQWTHIALSYDGAGNVALFVDDVESDNTGFSVGAGGANTTVGQFGGAGFSQGGIDELRFWNITRSATNLKGNWWTISPTTTGLVAYYNMNGSGTTMLNAVAPADPTTTGTLQGSASYTASPVELNANGIAFDGVTPGVDNKVIVPNNVQYNFSVGTVEFWMNANSVANSSDMIANAGPGAADPINYYLLINPSTQQLGLYNGTAANYLPFNPTIGTWYHIAYVSDGTQTEVYINGVLQVDATSTPYTLPAFSGAVGQPLYMGVTPNGCCDAAYFDGSLDEVRLWNVVRTASEIQNNMNATLTGTEPGLVGQFSFNQGIPNGTNTYMTTALDNTANNNHGTITNLSLTGTTSNFVAQPTTLPVNFTQFTATAQQAQTYLHWQTAQEENSKEFSVERSTDGTNYAPIGSVPAAGNSSKTLNYSFIDPSPVNGNNYYRLKEIDLDEKYMYSIVRVVNFAVTGHELVWFKTGDKAVEVDYKTGSNELYSVYDMNGRTIQQGQLSSGKLYLTQLASGLYSVKIHAASGDLQTKVVVQ